MSVGSWIIGILLGIPSAAGIALLIVGSALNKSNNFGDSKGEIANFADKNGFVVLFKKDRVKADTPVGIYDYTPLPPQQTQTVQPVQQVQQQFPTQQ